MYPRYRRRQSGDLSQDAAGCTLLILFGVFIVAWKVLYQVFRYRPQPYHPAAPHVGREAGMAYRFKWRIAVSLLGTFIFAIQFLNALADPSYMNGENVYVGLIGLVASAGSAAYYYWRHRVTRLDPASIDLAPLFPDNPRLYSIFPAQTAADFAAAGNLIQALAVVHAPLTFQIVASGERTVWRIVDPQGKAPPQAIITAVRSHYAQAVVVEDQSAEDGMIDDTPVYRQQLFFGLANDYAAPIAFVEMLKNDDPLIALTRRMDFLASDQHERVTYSLLVLTASAEAQARAWERLKEGSIVPLASVPTAAKDDNLHGLEDRLLERKLSATLYHAFLVITLESAEQSRLAELAELAGDVARLGIAGHNHLLLSKRSSMVNISGAFPPVVDISQSLFADLTDQTALWRQTLLVLTPAELASLWHLPDERFSAKRIAWAGIPVPDEVTSGGEDRVCLGQAAGIGTAQPIYVSMADRAYHLSIMGKTGTGKSTLMHNLIHQDIAAGRGVVVIDPHGKLIDDIVRTSIPDERHDDLILLELGQIEHPVPLNPFRIPLGVTPETAFNFVYWVMRKLYESVWRDRMDYVFRNTVQTLLTDQEATPRDIARLLLNADYRSRVMAKLDESAWSLQEFWAWYEAQPRSEQMEIASPILTRTGVFLGNRAVELMTCYPGSLNVASLLRDQKIVLINLSGEGIHAEVGTLGAILLAQLFIAAQTLGYLGDHELPRAYLYIDEVERMVTTPIPEMFATARKFGLSLTLANQYMRQLSDATLESVLGNVGTQLVFEVGENDSRRLARLFEPEIPRETLLKLGAYHVAVRTRADGKSIAPFVMKTLPPPIRPADDKDRDDGHSDGFRPWEGALTGAEVQAWLAERYRVEVPKKSQDAVSTDGLVDYDER